jgi:F1F0 ATPase subunit 2
MFRMNEMLPWALAGVVGVALGIIFFGGLWWTVRKAVASNQPGLWFLGSLFLRMSIVLGGFHSVLVPHWERALPCIVGFVMARWTVTRLTRHTLDEHPVEEPQLDEHQTHPAREDSHAY